MSKLLRLVQIALVTALMVGCMNRPAPRNTTTYFTHRISYPGETLALISSWYTGSANNWQSVAAANPGLDPKRLRMGTIVNIPEYMVVRREMLPKKLVASAPRTKVQESVSNDAPDLANEQAVQAAQEAVDQAVEEQSEQQEAAVIEQPAAPAEVSASEVEESVVATPALVAVEEPASEPAAVVEPVIEKQDAPVEPPKGAVTKSRDELWKELLEE